MAGIYVHIPFCASRCIYCGFYSTTLLEWRQRYVDAVCREWQMRRNYLAGEPIHTIYIGGGTPSMLSLPQLQQLLDALTADLPAGSCLEEVTLECNPDDVTEAFAEGLRALPVNRVSMGVQTFSDDRLRFLHRRHEARHAAEAVSRLRRAGIGNISIDLMYGFPGESLADWHDDIARALDLQVEHLSAYALMYEEDTPLYRLLQEGKVAEADEELQLRMFSDLIDRLTAAGFEHYEISNFARPGRRSRHNSSYWQAVPYIGLGAAAHSYDGTSRQWNVDNLVCYAEAVEQGRQPFEREELDDDTRYNEMVMTSLRTREGLALDRLAPHYRAYCTSQAAPYLSDHLLVEDEGRLRLTRRGIFVSNMVMSGLMHA